MVSEHARVTVKLARSETYPILLVSVSILMVAALVAINVLHIYPHFISQLIRNEEEDASRIAIYLESQLLKQNEVLSRDIFRIKDRTRTFQAAVKTYKLMKARVFSKDGTIIYSSDTADIGKVNTHAYFRDIVSLGNNYSKLVTKLGETQEGVTVYRDVVEVYVPIMNKDVFVGAFELYYDIDDKKRELDGIMSEAMFLQACICVILILIVLHVARSYSVAAKDRLNYAENMEDLANARARQLVHADRLASLGTLSASIAHEINNPVSFISGNAMVIQAMWSDIESSLQRSRESGAGNQEKLLFILKEFPPLIGSFTRGSKRIADIVHSLKSFSRSGDNTRDECDINACIKNALELCNGVLKYQVVVEQDLASKIPSITANSQQLEQVFVNLFGNAADAIGENQGELKISSSCNDNMIHVEVSNNGPTIPEDVLPRLFDPFFTTKPVGEGTGLGLSISSEIIRNHGGRLIAENIDEGGVKFTVELPQINKFAVNKREV